MYYQDLAKSGRFPSLRCVQLVLRYGISKDSRLGGNVTVVNQVSLMAFMGAGLSDVGCVTLFLKLDFRGQLWLLLQCQLLCCTAISLPISG